MEIRAMDSHESSELEKRVQGHEELLIALLMVVQKVNPAAFKELQTLFAERRGRTVHVDGFPDALRRAEAIVEVASKLHAG
jgi:hypothetical protein